MEMLRECMRRKQQYSASPKLVGERGRTKKCKVQYEGGPAYHQQQYEERSMALLLRIPLPVMS